MSSGQHVVQDIAVDVGQAALDAIVVIRQSGMVDAEQVQDGRVDSVLTFPGSTGLMIVARQDRADN